MIKVPYFRLWFHYPSFKLDRHKSMRGDHIGIEEDENKEDTDDVDLINQYT